VPAPGGGRRQLSKEYECAKWRDQAAVYRSIKTHHYAIRRLFSFIIRAVFLINQRTLGQILTMSDALGRPLMIANPKQPGQYLIAGFPVRVATQMPDTAPGATPMLFGNLQAAYLLVYRRQTTMLQDPYLMGYCILFRFESRVGGTVVCQNAARLLRIK
jgi:HK97 family phage major capsid protein